MTCSTIAARIEKTDPSISPMDVARMSTLLVATSSVEDLASQSNEQFMNLWEEVNLRLAALSDQHAAVTCELEKLAESDPQQFSQEQIWVLIRAIKIQNQLIRVYAGDPEVELTP